MKLIERHFLIFIIVLSTLGFLIPAIFVLFLPYLSYLLALVMLFMGITLQKEELLKAFKNWKFAVLGTFLQFLIMPSLAFFLGKLFQLPLEYQIGLVLVGACPGGTASNVMVYLFGGNVSLSILMTTLSTVLSVVLTPFLLEFYIGSQLELPIQKMVLDIFLLVFIPLVLGYFGQRILVKNQFQKLESISTFIAILVIAIIISAIVAANVSTLQTIPYVLILVIILHNGLGLASGYFITRIFTSDKTIARTIAIEVGMQNSGLGVVLANLHFTKITALPAAFFSFWHNVSGVSLANHWKKKNSIF